MKRTSKDERKPIPQAILNEWSESKTTGVLTCQICGKQLYTVTDYDLWYLSKVELQERIRGRVLHHYKHCHPEGFQVELFTKD